MFCFYDNYNSSITGPVTLNQLFIRMGQNTSKEPSFLSKPPVFDEDISVRRRHRMRRNHSNRISISGLESGTNIDSILSKMGVQAEFEETPFSGTLCFSISRRFFLSR